MAVYRSVYSVEFKNDLRDFEFDKNIADGIEKAIPIILEKPYHKAAKLKGQDGLLRKHVCANRFRIFYYIDNKNKEVIFVAFRPKNKNTYKNL